MAESNQRCTVIYDGRVQGVGFRMSTCQAARGFKVTGWVRNETDGSVRAVVEGERGEIDRFLEDVRDRMAGFISTETVTWGKATGEFTRFTVAH